MAERQFSAKSIQALKLAIRKNKETDGDWLQLTQTPTTRSAIQTLINHGFVEMDTTGSKYRLINPVDMPIL